jgi:hypothetical protein
MHCRVRRRRSKQPATAPSPKKPPPHSMPPLPNRCYRQLISYVPHSRRRRRPGQLPRCGNHARLDLPTDGTAASRRYSPLRGHFNWCVQTFSARPISPGRHQITARCSPSWSTSYVPPGFCRLLLAAYEEADRRRRRLAWAASEGKHTTMCICNRNTFQFLTAGLHTCM